MPRHDKGIAAVFARARAGDRRLSPWMTRHHDELVREIGTGRVEWAAALCAFADLGLTDEHGRPLTRDTASRTWRRVREAVAAGRQAEATARPSPGELVPGVRLIASAPASMPVRPPPAPAAAPIAGTPAGAVEATEHIAAVLAGMSASRVPLPSQPSRHPQPVPMRPVHEKDPTP
ncbi:hypothetical protein [Methylobacterium sp. E-066]|uniref:hypothetical protein n=1 Tax=Methylobacterium sp. E-066 TaxID=2836584 RepID=UPI001FB8CD50|nr:hypothetical protein [Methylobacterium sp. E-066]MCJ2139428.1 hypothetical protein [Methylobacterium sp. E-066]